MILYQKIELKYSARLIAMTFLLVVAMGSNVSAQTPYARMVQKLGIPELGIRNSAGIAYSRTADAFLIAPRKNASDITILSSVMRTVSSVTPAAAIPNPVNMAFDDKTNRLVFFDEKADELIAMEMRMDGSLDNATETVSRYVVKLFNAKHLQGFSFNPETGDVFFLVVPDPPNSAHVIGVTPDPAGSFDGLLAREDGRVHDIVLNSLPQSNLKGIAYNPNDGHLYVMSPDEQKLYGLDSQGQVVNTRDVSAFHINDVQNMLFAPSGDQTDDQMVVSLYIAYGGLDSKYRHGDIIELTLTQPQSIDFSPMALRATLVQTIFTSLWSPPSPDASGGAYLPASNTILISDGEVNEMPIFAGVNVWETSLLGTQVREFTTFDIIDSTFSDEPSGVAFNPYNNHLYFTDDTGIRRVYEMDPGVDALYGTSDDIITSFRTALFGSTDPEGIAFDIFQGHLFIADGVNSEVYEISPGSNGFFDGVPPSGDDVLINNFDTAVLGLQDPEGVEFNSDNGDLYIVSQNDHMIVETNRSGVFLQTIDFSTYGVTRPAGLIYAPTSNNPSERSIYLIDRGVDNDNDPNENDGKIFELGLGSLTPSLVIDDVVVIEGNETTVNAVFTVRLSGVSQDVTVNYATANGSATTFNNDYIANSGQLAFEPGVTSLPITVVVNGDMADEPDETFFVNLSNAVNANIADNQGVGTIINDDGQAPVSVSFQDGVNGYGRTRDTKLLFVDSTGNYGSETWLELDGAPDESTLLFWDLTDIPLGSTIQSVDITVNVTDSSGASYEIYDLKREWVESEATWKEFAAGQSWEVRGADGPADRGTTSFGWIDGFNSGLRTVTLNSAGVAMVQSWVDDPSSNHGFIIQDYVTASNGMDFDSREVATIANRPKLTVTYTTPTLTLLTPNGGELWEIGNTVNITWNSFGTSGTVRIEYSTDNSSTWSDIVAVTDDDGTEPWTIPNTSTTQALVRISDTAGNGPADSSDAVFTIIPASVLSTSFQDGVNGYNGTRDANLVNDSPGSNFGSANPMELDGESGSSASILLYWDLTGIPIGSTVYAVGITLDVTHGSSQEYEFYEVKRPWIESEATWNSYASGFNWEVPGATGSADRGTAVLSSITPSSGTNILSLNAAGVALVQSWIDDPSFNHGLIIMDYGNSSGADLSSREAGTADRPIITLIHEPPPPTVLVEAKIFLEGPYDAIGDSMKTDLRDNNFIPATSPFSEDPRTVSSPIPLDITDWVLVELREAATGTAVASKSAFLRNDGRIVDDDGSTEQIPIEASDGNYYVVVKHRNHLAAMSFNAVQLSSGSFTLYDFTIDIGQYYGVGGAKEIETGIWGMWSGDIDQSRTVDANDRASSWNNRNSTGYIGSDCKLSGTVDANSRAITWNNRNKISTLP